MNEKINGVNNLIETIRAVRCEAERQRLEKERMVKLGITPKYFFNNYIEHLNSNKNERED